MHYTDQKVLLVDDDTTMLDLLRRGLSADQDLYEVICVKTAQEAVDFLERVHFCMVVADIQMPNLSGLDLLAKIRDRWPHIKVILMTASESPCLEREIRSNGCLRLFQKPIRMAELRALIAKELAAPDTGGQGFAGRLTNIKLSDLIQMCCASGISTVIQVRKNRSVGTIFIEEGEIIHADCGDIQGLAAFYEIFSWQSGSFETLGDVAVPKTTIDKNWQYLLMEGHRRMDEARAASSAPHQDGPDAPGSSHLAEECLALCPEEIEDERPGGEAAAPTAPGSGRTSVRVLIVDDSPLMCRALTGMLSSAEGIEVVGTAQNGEEALEKMDRVRPDLITLDVNMPVMNGSTALKHIMIRSPCPVVIVSAANGRTDANILDFLLLGAVDYVQKPVRGAEMARERLVHAVRGAALARTDRFRRARPPAVVNEFPRPETPLASHDGLVVVCSGAGGYGELVKIISLLPVDFKGAVVAIQAMCNTFQEAFAGYLDRRSHLAVRPLGSEQALAGSHCYLASGETAVRLERAGQRYVLRRGGNEGVCLPRESMPGEFLTSAAGVLGGRLLTVLLSGASTGTLAGLEEIRRQGGRIISQDINSCLVPQPLQAARDAGMISASMDHGGIVSEMVRFCTPPAAGG